MRKRPSSRVSPKNERPSCFLTTPADVVSVGIPGHQRIEKGFTPGTIRSYQPMTAHCFQLLRVSDFRCNYRLDRLGILREAMQLGAVLNDTSELLDVFTEDRLCVVLA